MLSQVAGYGIRLEPRAGETDVAVGARGGKATKRPANAPHLLPFVRVVRYRVRPQKTARHSTARRRLPEDEQIEARVVELLEQVLDRPVRLELEPQPGEAVAGARRAFRHARE